MPRVQSREIAGRRDWLPRKETRVFIEKLGAGAGAWRSARQVLQESMRNFFKENSLMVSASIAYHSLLSIFPFLLLLLGVGDGRGDHERVLFEKVPRSEEHTSELQSRPHLVCRLLLEKKKKK